MKLESLPVIPKDKRDAFGELAMSLFLANPPVDPRQLKEFQDKKTSKHDDAMLDNLMGDRDQVG